MAIRVAGVPVVVRASELDVVARLSDRFAPWLTDHPGSEPAISLAVSTSEDGRRTANSVHRHGFLVRTTHSLDAALDTVERVLHTFAPGPDGATPMHARALERDGSVVLASDTFREALDGHHRRVTAAGFVDGGYGPVLVDSVRAQALLAHGSLDEPDWRRVPIAAAVVFAPTDVPDSPAVQVTHFTALIAGRDHPTSGADVQGLVDLMARVAFVRLDTLEARDVVRTLVATPPS